MSWTVGIVCAQLSNYTKINLCYKTSVNDEEIVGHVLIICHCVESVNCAGIFKINIDFSFSTLIKKYDI